MASTTTNLGLTKPAYSDDADISDINGNMDLIDAEAGKVRANVAANYDSSETYAVGDYCLHDGNLYKCTTAISSPESWTAGHWTQIKIAGELSSLTDQIGTLNGKIANITTRVNCGTIASEGSASVDYPTGFNYGNSRVIGHGYTISNGDVYTSSVDVICRSSGMTVYNHTGDSNNLFLILIQYG